MERALEALSADVIRGGGNRQRGYRRDIDGLRCIAVSSVLLFHAFPQHLPGGFVGVDIFFVISGFLITGILLREAEERRFSILRFYARRVRRIFPALLVMMVAVLVAGWLLLASDMYEQLGKHIAGGAGFVSNVLLWNEESYFGERSTLKPLLHLWSLGVEEQFYIVWPLLIYLIIRFKLRASGVIMGLAVASFLSSLYMTVVDPTAAFYSPLSRFWQLSVGGAVAAAEREGWAVTSRHALSLVGAALLIAAVLLINRERQFPGFWALLPVLGAAMLIASGEAGMINRLIGNRLAVGIGLISYPLYLWHWPLLVFATISNQMIEPLWRVRAGLMLLAVIAAAATFWWVEKPLRALHPGKLVTAMVAVFGTGIAVMAAAGVPWRAVRQDPRSRFLAHYREVQRSALSSAYREECDFVAWRRLKVLPRIASSCTLPGRSGTYLLWGDSHAQALSFGLRRHLPAGYALAQVATSDCTPALPSEPGFLDLRGPLQRACRKSNEFAMESIRALRPDIVFLAQHREHERRDWETLARRLREAGAKKVVLIGPVPQWYPSLPSIVARYHWPLRQKTVSTGLDTAVLETDRRLSRVRFANLTYISLLRHLCARDGCLAKVGEGLITLDSGHLTPEGSVYVGAIIMQDLTAPSNRPGASVSPSDRTNRGLPGRPPGPAPATNADRWEG